MVNSASIELIKALGVPIISDKRRYWFVRTTQGQFREEFFDEKFIGINWNDFNDIKSIRRCKDDEDYKIELREKLIETIDMSPQELYGLNNEKEVADKKVKKAGRILGQIIRFVNDMKIGDIVIIPDEKSTKITFGIVESDIYLNNLTPLEIVELEANNKCGYIKRRKVKWIKTVYREKIDPLLCNKLRAQQAVSCLDDSAHLIDRILEPLYYKNGRTYFTFRIEQKDDINAYDMFSVYGLAYNTLKINKDELLSKVNVQSPGEFQWISSNAGIIIALAMVIPLIIGGARLTGAKYKKINLDIGELEIPGLCKWFIEYQDKRNKSKKIDYDYQLANKKMELDHKLEMEKISIEKIKVQAQKEITPLEIEQLNNEFTQYRDSFSRLEISIDNEFVDKETNKEK